MVCAAAAAVVLESWWGTTGTVVQMETGATLEVGRLI